MSKLVLLIAAFALTISALGYFSLSSSTPKWTAPTRNHRVLPSSLRPGVLAIQKEPEQEVIYGLTEDDRSEVVYAINQLKKKITKESPTEPSLFIKSGIPLINWDEELAQKASLFGENCPSANKSSFRDKVLVARTFKKEASLTEMVKNWKGLFEAYNAAGNQEEYTTEKIGCARNTCYMDDRQTVSLVCKWEFEGNVLVKA